MGWQLQLGLGLEWQSIEISEFSEPCCLFDTIVGKVVITTLCIFYFMCQCFIYL